MNSPQKSVTLYISTNDETKNFKFHISFRTIKLLTFAIIFLIFLSLAAVIDYFGLLTQSIENKKLKIENANLQKQFQIVQGKLDSLQSAIDRVVLMSNKLKLITDTTMKDRTERLSFPAIINNQSIQDAQKAENSVSNMADNIQNEKEDLVEEDKLNLVKGELAIEKSNANYSSLVIKIDEAVKDTTLKEQTVNQLWESLADSQSLLAATPSIKPAQGAVGSGFGFRIDPINGKQKMHAGLDIVAPSGTIVRAPADGVVSFVGWDDFYGRLVSIDHGYGVLTRYAHNSQIYVQVGQKVSKFDVISAVGSTGRSTGPHLHYEVRINDIPVNPLNYILDE